MGMFDTFEVTQKLKCKCGNTFVPVAGVQCKAFECALEYFDLNDVVQNVGTRVVEDYDWCPSCKIAVPVFFAFNSDIYVGGFSSYKKAEKAIKQFDIIAAYKVNYKKLEQYKGKWQLLNDRLTFVTKYFSNPKKQYFNFFFNFHASNYMDYDLLTTLKNILKLDANED